MKILYFHQHFSTPRGAAGIRSYEMARAAVAAGHDVSMVCGSYGLGQTGLETPFHRGRREGTVDGIHVIEFNLSYSNSDGFLRRVGVFAKFALGSIGVALSRKYDVAFATTTPLTAGIPGICARWLRGKPFVFEVRDLWPELPKAMGVIRNPVILGLMSMLEWTSYRSAHRLVGLSPGICKGITERGVPDERVMMVPNGCDLDIFAADNIEPWRPEGVGPNDLMAVFSGTHGQANGLDAVLNAAQILKTAGRNDIKFVLIGDGKLKPALRARADELKLDNVLFLEPVNKSRLASLLRGADLGMQILANVPAFYYGTSPNKFFDYIAAGLPVLNNYPGWLAGLIEENGCGFAVPPENPEAFAAALIKAADNRAELAEMGRRSRALAESGFNRAKLASQWVAWVTEGRRT